MEIITFTCGLINGAKPAFESVDRDALLELPNNAKIISVTDTIFDKEIFIKEHAHAIVNPFLSRVIVYERQKKEERE